MAASRSALLTLAALTALAGCCVCAPQGSVQGGVQGGAQVPPVSHSTAPPGVGGVRRERRSIHSASIVDRRCDGSGGVLAIGQLLVARAGGRAGGRLTRDGGRMHARVAPALRGAQPGRPGFTIARAAARALPRPPALFSPPPDNSVGTLVSEFPAIQDTLPSDRTENMCPTAVR